MARHGGPAMTTCQHDDDPTTRCVIVDDHVLLLDLLVGVVRTIPGVSVVATGTDVTDAERIAGLDRIDLLVVDRSLPSGDGMDLTRKVVARHPAVTCVVIAGSTKDFVCPPELIENVVSVVDKAHAADMLLGVIAQVVGPPPGQPSDEPGDDVESRLTPRELELFAALGEGLSNKEIGQRFGITTRTVETHRRAIARKLGQSGAALVHLATIHRHGAPGRPPRPLPSVDPSLHAAVTRMPTSPR